MDQESESPARAGWREEIRQERSFLIAVAAGIAVITVLLVAVLFF